MNSILVWDVETDGFDPTEIFVLSIEDFETGDIKSYTSETGDIVDGLMRLAEADLVIGHWIKGFDIPVVERLTAGIIRFDPNKIVDTCELSRQLFPELDSHKLRVWGDILGFPKGDWSDFSKFDWGMVPYCERDVQVTSRTARFFFEIMADAAAKAA